MAINSSLQEYLIRAFNPNLQTNSLANQEQQIEMARRLGIPVEQIFNMESGSNEYRINPRSYEENQSFQQALRYGDTLENLYNRYVPQDLRDYFSGPGVGQQFFGQGDRVMGIDPLTGQQTGLWQFAGAPTMEGDPGSAPGAILPDRLAQAYQSQLRPSWVQKDIPDGLFQEKLFSIGASLPAGYAAWSALAGGAAAPFSEIAAGEAALASEAAAAGSAAAGGTAGGAVFDPSSLGSWDVLPGAEAPWGAGESVSGNFLQPGWSEGAMQTGTFDQYGALSYPGGAGQGAGAGTIYANTATPNVLEKALGLPAGTLGLGGDNASGGGTSLGNILTPGGGIGGAGIPDWLLKLLPAGIGAFASSQQASAIRDIAEKARADRQPFYQKAVGYLNDPNSYATGPGAATLDAVLRRLSVGGNPIGDPAKLGIATSAGLQDWRNTVLGLGNLGLAGEDTRASLDLGAVKADKGVWDSLGAGVADVVKPQKSLEDILKSMGGMKLSLT